MESDTSVLFTIEVNSDDGVSPVNNTDLLFVLNNNTDEYMLLSELFIVETPSAFIKYGGGQRKWKILPDTDIFSPARITEIVPFCLIIFWSMYATDLSIFSRSEIYNVCI